MTKLLKQWWCEWMHRGGDIKRDELGRINWQCRCGRWSDSPVPLNVEAAAIDEALEGK